MSQDKKKLALVIGCLPSIEEIDQFRLITEGFDFEIITSESIAAYITQNSYFQDLTCVVLQDHEENPTFIPGLEKVLSKYDIVVVKERIGLYAYQVLKAKWRFQFRMLVWVDNLVPFPANDIDQMRTIRTEVTNAADGFLVQSAVARSTLELEGIESERIHEMIPWTDHQVVRNPKVRAEAREKLGFAESDFVIGCLGPVEWEEGLYDLMAAVRLLINQRPGMKDKIKIAVSGIGSFAHDLKDASINFGTDYCVAYFAPNRDATKAIYEAVDGIFVCNLASRDRIDGDPYRILSAMNHKIPLIAARSPIIEAMVGKHRLDFCPGSSISLSKALIKLKESTSLVKDITTKNVKTIEQKFSKSKAQENMLQIFDEFVAKEIKVDTSSLDHQVLEVEAKIKSKQYVDAIDLIEAIFKTSNIPVLMLTARGEDMDRILGLELGADDYLPKPCNPRELVARLKAILRRTKNNHPPSSNELFDLSLPELGHFRVERQARRVLLADQEIKLTATEFDLLECLINQPDTTISKQELSIQVLGKPLSSYDRSLDMHISNLRKKLPDPISAAIDTIRGIGYRYTPSEIR